MYIPQHYKNENLAEVRQFIKENGFGILVSNVNGKHWASHIPFELEIEEDGKEYLVSHISKGNPQWKYFNATEEVLCIFNGPHSYISSSWYKEEEVPTWNYIAIHVYGTLQILSEEEVLQSMHRLVDRYEKDSKKPISLKELSSKTLRQVKGVIGFKILITDIQATYKLSQTRPQDHAKIIEELSSKNKSASNEIADQMIKQTKRQ